MSVELTQCPICKLFVSLRGYDHHIMRCGCEPCEGRGYFDSRHPGYRGHTTCSWCNGTGRASVNIHEGRDE
jgi:hypothetical protein